MVLFTINIPNARITTPNKYRTSITGLIAAAQNVGDKTNLESEPQQPCRSLIQSVCPTECWRVAVWLRSERRSMYGVEVRGVSRRELARRC